jgi:seryl-tRNA synthetase
MALIVSGLLYDVHTSAYVIDPALFRDNLEAVRTGLTNRGVDMTRELEELAALESRRRRLLPELEGLKRDQNTAADEVARAKRQGQDTTKIQEANRQRAAQIKQLGVELDLLEQRRNHGLLVIPNIPHPSVPVGKSADDNKEVRRVGTPRNFTFAPQPHWDLGPALGIIDFERGTKIAGARFTVLLGAGARLARALINFMLDLHTKEHGYKEVEPPFMANTATLTGTGNLPKFEADLFKIAGDWDLYLVPTAEVPLTNLHRGEILDGRSLPIRYTAYTPCFRSEAGSYGADVRGLIRQHQFDKVELMAFARPENSYDELERLTNNAEEVLKRLELPVPDSAAVHRRHGIRVGEDVRPRGLASEPADVPRNLILQQYGGVQARRANIKFRPEAGGRTDFVHTLNGSGLAVGRTLIAILENYQQEDGSVTVPTALRPYMDGRETITRS